MNQLQSPIADVAVAFYINRPKNLLGDNLAFEFTKTVELIRSLAKSEGVSATTEKLKADLFDLKLKMLPLLLKDENFWTTYRTKISSEIAVKLNSYTELGAAVADLLLVFDGLIEGVNTDNMLPQQVDVSLLNYEVVKTIEKLIAGSEHKSIFESFDLALELDCACIIAELLFAGQLKLSKDEQRILIRILRDKGELFAMRSIENGMLSKVGPDLSQIHRNARIRVSMNETQAGITSRQMTFAEVKRKLSA